MSIEASIRYGCLICFSRWSTWHLQHQLRGENTIPQLPQLHSGRSTHPVQAFLSCHTVISAINDCIIGILIVPF